VQLAAHRADELSEAALVGRVNVLVALPGERAAGGGSAPHWTCPSRGRHGGQRPAPRPAPGAQQPLPQPWGADSPAGGGHVGPSPAASWFPGTALRQPAVAELGLDQPGRLLCRAWGRCAGGELLRAAHPPPPKKRKQSPAPPPRPTCLMVKAPACHSPATLARPSTMVSASCWVRMPALASALAYAWLPCGAEGGREAVEAGQRVGWGARQA
jgi:hypothetical protein